MTWSRALALSAGTIYAILVGGIIDILSDSPYEWMIGEVHDNRKLTICDLPPPSDGDDAINVYVPLTIALVLVPLIAGIVRYIRASKVGPALVIGVALLAVWIYRFFLRDLGC